MTSNLGSEYILENNSNSDEMVMQELKHNFNDGPATVKLTLTVKPAEVVPTPTPVPLSARLTTTRSRRSKP